jgi:hypothetical protein
LPPNIETPIHQPTANTTLSDSVEAARTLSTMNLFRQPANSTSQPIGLQSTFSQEGTGSHQQTKVEPMAGSETKSALDAMMETIRNQFYNVYGKIHEEKVMKGCQLMTQEHYEKIVYALQASHQSEQ